MSRGALRASGGTLALSVVLIVASTASAQTMAECQKTREEQRRAARAESDAGHARCEGNRGCLKEAQAKWNAAVDRIDAATSACRSQARRAMAAEPPPYLNWKPGDPPPQAKDGRRYLMSCSGKVLGLYKPGGALEIELKTRPGNCIPVDNWGTLPAKQKDLEWGWCRDGTWGPRSAGDPCNSGPPPR